jgi:hypothetical protein
MNVDALLADLSEMLDIVDLHNPTAVLGRPLAVVLTHVELNEEGDAFGQYRRSREKAPCNQWIYLEELIEVDDEGEELRRPSVGVTLELGQEDGQDVLLEKLLLNLWRGQSANGTNSADRSQGMTRKARQGRRT